PLSHETGFVRHSNIQNAFINVRLQTTMADDGDYLQNTSPTLWNLDGFAD
ncbi:7989_t:CDS:1, partial [Paraglomus occultum]